MDTMKKLITLALLVTAITSLAAASAADMTIFPSESSTRIDSFTSYEVNIENVGPVKDVYDITSSNPGEISIAPRQVELQPGQEETINVWYNPETSKDAGTYSFSVTAASQATGDSYSVDGTVNVIKEHKVAIGPDSVSKTGCLGEQVVYTLEVTNNGIQKEEFSLETRAGQLSQTDLTLEDGETATVKLTISSNEPVQNNFNVVAASKTSYAQDIQNLEFNSEVCYASETSVTPQQKDVAAFTEAEYTVNVRNTGTKEDTFSLSSSIGTFEDSELEIEGKSSEQTTLSVTPENLGTQTIQIAAEGESTSSATATLNVNNGMNVGVAAADQEVQACEAQEGTLEYEVENTGVAEETYNIQANRGNLSTEELRLDPGEEEDVEVALNTENFETGSHQIELTAAAQTFGEPVKSASTNLVVENCWDLDMDVIPDVQSAGENRSTIYRIQLNNTGTQENTYRLSYEGPEWISIKPESVTVPAGESETAYIYAGIPYQKQGEVKITAIAQGNESIQRTEEVRLLIGEEVEDAIESEEGGGITGAFTNSISNFVSGLGTSDNLTKIVISILVGLAITVAVLYSEW